MEFTSKSTLTKKLDAVDEFERTPIPDNKLKGAGSFWGMYAGEHIAGTEFVIGPLFVAHGISAGDLVSGLLVGNFLAVLSWAFICAPIAMRRRLTLYYQLEKICGPRLTLIYNLVNALMFCFLAGAMIAVSATAMGIPFNMTMPSLNDFYPSMEFAPGPVAYRAAGLAGVICVIVAGWTTANPTIYRAGLALQALMPRSKTWKVTMIIGLITTLAACFPALVMKLLDFVALYGLILMPMGAVIFADFWLLPKLGLKQDYAEWQQIVFSWPAAFTWGATLLICFLLPIELFFKALPGWFIAIGLYVSLSYVQQRVQVKELAGAKI